MTGFLPQKDLNLGDESKEDISTVRHTARQHYRTIFSLCKAGFEGMGVRFKAGLLAEGIAATHSQLDIDENAIQSVFVKQESNKSSIL